MGIARRKAGSVVNCPKCNGQVVVPTPENEPAAVNPPTPGGPTGGGVFDVSDFGQELAAGGFAPQQLSPQMEPQAWNNPIAVNAGDEFDVVPLAASSIRPRGLLLSPMVLTLVAVLAVMLVGLAFVVGLLIGQSRAG